ncbi:hypothetical protein DY000_02032092 [Brassica cretica]|uniref:Uncharacterized protein n=1 Tax=Brassica cretica TaxID=69181 RepID=A0ABQ7DBP1_BRACR|nr:hypothetical protein DY000_02032092 [Brassica cretica]
MCLECHFVVGAGNKLSGFDAVFGPSLVMPLFVGLLEDPTQTLSVLQARSSLGSKSSYHSCLRWHEMCGHFLIPLVIDLVGEVVRYIYLCYVPLPSSCEAQTPMSRLRSRCRPLHFFDFKSDRSGAGKLGDFEWFGSRVLASS